MPNVDRISEYLMNDWEAVCCYVHHLFSMFELNTSQVLAEMVPCIPYTE